MNNFLIYLHKKSNGEIFYVGLAKNKNRPYSKDMRNKFWYNIVNKYGYYVEIIHDSLSKNQACRYEKKYIKQFGRRDLGDGQLVNMTEGGDGLLNPSKQTKQKIARSLLGRKNGSLSKETKLKISKSNRGTRPSKLAIKNSIKNRPKGKNHYNYNKHQSDETKEKISNKLKGRKNTLEQIENWKKSVLKNKKLNWNIA